MTLYDTIKCCHTNKGHIYTTDELWEDDENCILEDSLGNLVYGNSGEIVIDIEALPKDGWYDATDMNEQQEEDILPERPKSFHTDVLWDENEMDF
jgi:hypothetical protein